MAEQVLGLTRTCSKCGEEKRNDASCFFEDKRRGTLNTICKECCKVRARALYRRKIIDPREASRERLPAGAKRCKRCKSVLGLGEFFPSKDCRQGCRPECRRCTIARQRQTYLSKTEGRKRVRRIPYATGDLRRCGTCGDLKPADQKHFPPKRGAVIQLSSRCRDCTRSHSLALSKRPDQKAKRRINKLNRQAMMRGASGYVSEADITWLKKAQRNTCWWCQEVLTEHHVDHRISIKRGGRHHLSNLVLSCPSCNLRKQTKMPWEIDRPRLL